MGGEVQDGIHVRCDTGAVLAHQIRSRSRWWCAASTEHFGEPKLQNFAYALLKHFGYEISPFRSSNLWEDTEETVIVTGELRALDLLLFNRTSSPWGAHVALYLGGGKAIHLSKKESTAAIWPFAQFQMLAEYRIFIGAKRLRKFSGAN